jgi:hypothetical protein
MQARLSYAGGAPSARSAPTYSSCARRPAWR